MVKIDTDILNQLIPNILTVLTQLCATGILFFLLYKLAWKPVKKIIDARSEYEQKRLEKAEQLKEENEKLNQQATAQIDDATLEAQQIVQKAQQEGSRLKENLIDEGKQKAQQLVEEAQHNITLQKKKMLEDMHGEIVEVAISAAEKMLQQKLDSKTDEESINSFIKEVSNK